MSKTSARRLVKKAAKETGVRPYVASAGRGDPSDVSPHTFHHSIVFRMIRREDNRLEDVILRLRIVVFRQPIKSTVTCGGAKETDRLSLRRSIDRLNLATLEVLAQGPIRLWALIECNLSRYSTETGSQIDQNAVPVDRLKRSHSAR